jgi:hypothetical protein
MLPQIRGTRTRKVTMAEKTPRKPKAKPKKKTWESPRVKSGRLFESNSLACGKAGPGQEGCQGFPKLS